MTPEQSRLLSLSELLLVACDQSYAGEELIGGESSLFRLDDPPFFDQLRPPFDSYHPDYVVAFAREDPSSGFKYVVYQNETTREVIVAMAGTDGTNLKDWWSDVTHYGWNQWSLNRVRVLQDIDAVLTSLRTAEIPFPRIHFTGQSLGGALAQYAAYEFVETHATHPPSQLSLVTFNALGGLAALREELPRRIEGAPIPGYSQITNTHLDISLVAGFQEVAHYVSLNDLVSRLGEGHLGGKLYAFTASDFQTFNPQTNEPFLLDTVSAHRIESGFYYELTQYAAAQVSALGEAISSGPMPQPQIAQRYLNLNEIQELASITGNLFRQEQTTSAGALAKLVFGGLATLTLGDSAQVNALIRAYVDTRHAAGKYLGIEKEYDAARDTNWSLRLRIAALALGVPVPALFSPIGLLVKTAGAIALAPVFRLVEGMTNDSGEFVLRSSFEAKRQGSAMPEGTFEEALQRSTLLGAALDATSDSVADADLDAIAALARDDVDGFAEAMVSDQEEWYGNTAKYLITRANSLGTPAIAQNALNQFWTYSRQSSDDNPTLLASISDQFIQSTSEWTNAVAPVNSDIDPPIGNSIQISGLHSYSQKRELWNSVIAGLDSILTLFAGTAQAAETHASATKAIADVKAAAQSVVISAGVSRSPFDNPTFDPTGATSTGAMKEGQVATYTVYLPYEAGNGGQRIQLRLSGVSASKLRILDRADEITPDAGGSFVLTIPEGAREISFGLWAKEDIDANEMLTLSATLTDSAGVATHRTQTELVLTVKAVDETDVGTVQIIDGTPLADIIDTAGVANEGSGSDIDPERASVLNGGAGGDRIAGGPSADTLSGGDGADWIYSYGVYDGNFVALSDGAQETVKGDAGNDLLQVVRGAARVEGGDGDDVLDATKVSTINIANVQWLDLGDHFSVRAGAAFVDSTGHQVFAYDTDFGDQDFSGVSRWSGDAFAYRAADRTYALLRDDGSTIAEVALSRFDTSFLGTTSVALYGGAGNDVAIGNNGADFIAGDAGDDWLAGNGGEDVLYGGSGDDHIAGGAGGDLVQGGDGADLILGEDGSDALYGGAGDDEIQGDSVPLAGAQSGDDLLDGGDGDDTLYGQGGSDVLYGGAGNDVLDGDSEGTPVLFQGADTLDGGAGDDQLYGRAGDDRLSGGEGNDTLSGGAGNDRLEGGSGNDLMGGFDGDDTLLGGSGDDELQGDAGNDSLAGGDGNDILYGQDGDDELAGGSGADQISGGDGTDVLSGDDGDDALYGDAGNDSLHGGRGDDVVQGGDGEDELFGEEGNDVLVGDTGEDVLSGGAGDDLLAGGAGADRYLIEIGGGADVIQDREGLSTIAFGAGITPADLLLSSGRDEAGNTYLVAEISSGNSVAILGGLDGSNEIYSFADGARLTREELIDQARRRAVRRTGTIGPDTLDGDLGDDELDGGAESDFLRGGIGDDVYLLNLGDNADVIEDTAGDDTIRFGPDISAASLTAVAGFDVFSGWDVLTVGYGQLGDLVQIRDGIRGGVEHFELADGTMLSRAQVLNRALTPLTVSGNEASEEVYGGGSQDRIFGQDGDDTLYGQDGDDQLFGGFGNDTLVGGLGHDTLAGEDGDDTYVFSPGSGADVVHDAFGANRLRFDGISYESLSLFTASDTQGGAYLVLDFGGDLVAIADGLTGGFESASFAGEFTIGRRALLADKLGEPLSFEASVDQPVDMSGGRFDDRIIGSSHADLIEGGGGNDVLAGREGDDVLRGGAGDDFMNGNEGVDRLEGGAGDDAYAIGATMDFDTIVDHEGVNTLWLTPGNPDDGFVAQASGNDLLITLRNSDEGARIVDYYSDPSRWQVRSADGTIHDAQSWIDALPAAPATETVENWEAIYRARVAAALSSNWLREGYELRSDGLYHWDSLFESTSIRSESHITRSIKEVSRLVDGDASRSTPALEQTGTSSLTTEVVEVDRYDLAGATFIPHSSVSNGTGRWFDLSAGGASGISMPQGSTVTMVPGPNARDPVTGEVVPTIAGAWFFPPDLNGSGTSHGPVKQTVTRSYFSSSVDQKYIVEEIVAGASDDHLSVFDYMVVDAGQGDDVITASEFFSGYYGPGQFLYGNAGNDTVSGSPMDDILIGGAGDDVLDGRVGGDDYVFFADDGADYVRDTGGVPYFYYVPGAPFYGQTFPVDTVDSLVLPAGIAAADITAAWETGLVDRPYIELERHGLFFVPHEPTVQSLYSTLTLSWGSQTVRVHVPHAEDLVGEGIEQVRFADGTVVPLLSLAPPYDTDPHLRDNVLTGVSGTVWGAAGNDTISGNGTLMGGEGDDLLIADENGAALLGGKGADTLVGGTADDQLGEESALEFFGAPNSYRGGAGNDLLIGTSGADVIYYDLGDGVDTFDDYYRYLDRNRGGPDQHHYADIFYGGDAYSEYAEMESAQRRPYRGQDRIVFGPGITPDMISLGLGSLFIRVGESGGIHFEGFNPSDPYRENSLGLLQFDDGRTLTYSQLIDRGFDHPGSDADDFFTGTAVSDRFVGGAGSDTYYFGYATGRDSIREQASAEDVDTLWVAGGASEVEARREGADLIVQRRASPGDRIALLDWYSDSSARIEIIMFDDGTSWDAAALEARVGAVVNEAPQLSASLPDQVLEEGQTLTVSLDEYFADGDPGDRLRFELSMAPSWISLDGMHVIASPGGADAGTFQLRVTAIDAYGASISDECEIVVLDVNVAPVLVNAPRDIEASEGEELLITLPAATFADSDPADSLTFAARLEDGSALPHWLSFDPATLTFSGTPRNEDAGALRVRIMALDSAGASSTALFTINVRPVNDAPIATGPLGEQAVVAGSVFDYVVPAGAFLELDSGDSLNFSAELADGSALPGWLAFDASNRRFSGVAQGNGRLDIRVTATDEAGASAFSLFVLGVTGDHGGAPVLAAPLQDQSVLEDSPFVFVIPANAFTDEGGALLYSAENLPDWLSFDPGSRRFSGTPANEDVGQHEVRVVASDDTGLSALDTFVISVINTNDAPTVQIPLEDHVVDAGSPFEFTLPANTFADVDAGDSLVLLAKLFGGSALPNWLSFDAASRTFSGNPKQKDIGLSHVAVTATDAAGASASADFGLVVRAPAGSTASGGAGDDLLFGNESDETLKAKGGSDYLYGDAGDDVLRGGAGSDVLQGGDGNDVLRGGTGQNLLDGGWGDDVIYGGQGSSFLAGGAGNDVLHVGKGRDVIAFNAGDGIDTVYGGRDGGNTISLGGAIDYDQLTLSKQGKDLVLGVGEDDKLVLKNWYAGNKSVLDLQIVSNAVEQFDFLGLVNAYDAARAETPGLTSWALTNALLQFHLSTSDDEAIGGDLAYWYAKTGSFNGLSLAAAQEAIGTPGFGADAQALRPFAGLQEGFAKLV